MHAVLEVKPVKPVFQDSLIIVICFLLSRPSRRCYINPGSLRLLCEPFTNTYESEKNVRVERCNAAQNAVVSLLRSWSGLICFTSDPACIQFLVQSLQLPDLDLVVCCFFLKWIVKIRCIDLFLVKLVDVIGFVFQNISAGITNTEESI